MKILHIATHPSGGAGRAAVSLHQAMLRSGIDSHILAAHGKKYRATQQLDKALWHLQRSPIKTWRSPAFFGSLTASEIDRFDADIVNLHWVTDGLLSVENIGRIQTPVVFTLYDMWLFCGSEHYIPQSAYPRWHDGYTRENRAPSESGFDVDRWTWRRKRRHWSPMHLITASQWLTDAAHRAALTKDWPVHKIPHVIDTNFMAPISRKEARKILDIRHSDPLILFLSSAGINDPRKGFHFLWAAMPEVLRNIPRAKLLIVGPRASDASISTTPYVSEIGPVSDDFELRALYCAADVIAVPSTEDTLPLTAMEAQSCGCPVVGFDTGGLRDIVSGEANGLLVKFGSANRLATALSAILDSANSEGHFRAPARDRAIRLWSGEQVVDNYRRVYAESKKN